MCRTILAGLFVLASATAPATAQHEPQLKTEIERGVIGLPIRSSDGQLIGLVTQAGIGDGEAVIIAEIERPLGIGPDVVAIPTGMFINRGDHIELAITADQVREKLVRPER